MFARNRFKTALFIIEGVQEAIFALNSIGVENSKWPRKRCIRQFVLIAERNAKSPSNQTEADQYTAENVILSEDHQGDIRLTS